jgi:hypothetical protein
MPPALKKVMDQFSLRLKGKKRMPQETVNYDAQAEQIYLFKRLGICHELAKILCSTLKNNDISQHVGNANTDGVSKVREIQYQLLVLSEAICAAMDHTKVPSNETLAATLEWCKEQLI